jgi:PAS domain S-box-containing protein
LNSKKGAASPEAELSQLQASLAIEQGENIRLRRLLEMADRLHAADAQNLANLLTSELALASSRAETRNGYTALLASELALATSRAETQESYTSLLASELALASSRADTEMGQSILKASERALATSRAETELGHQELRASAVALASSRAETQLGHSVLKASERALETSRAETAVSRGDLVASGAANRTMSLANALLVSNKAALRKSEERFGRLVEAAPNAMVMINSAGLIEMVNAQTERLFGYSRIELVGSSVEMLLPDELRAQHPHLRAGFFAVSSSRPMGAGQALFGQRKDGSKVQVEIGLSPIETEDGMMVLSAIIDISDRVRLETQMRQSQKMHAIGRVTAGVAHDFNNLLMAVGGSIELLLDEVADRPAAMEWGQVALRATLRGKELTGRLLSFSRQQLLTTRPIAIVDLFSEMFGLIGNLFHTNTRARTQLIMMPCAPGLAVLADLAQLETALINLAVNGRDAMASGGCLRISAYATDADLTIVPAGHYTVISVADTGSGMDAETLAQACEPFFSTKGIQGTGLGLSMVQGFARQSGGEAHITSALGEGTTIDLWLPSANAPAEVPVLAKRPAPTARRILVADDSQDSLLVVSAFLRQAGLDVTSALSGDLALAELATGRRFAAIVTDFAMPGMNGLELLALAREIDPAMRGMIITGFSDPELLSELSEILVLRKPFNRAELVETVQTLIAAKPAAVPVV